MIRAALRPPQDPAGTVLVRQLADQAFSRASGAPLRDHNSVTLLRDAAENYPRWLDAIRSARRTIHFEMYIIHEDEQGRLFADALLAKARAGVTVRLLYDWMGGVGKTSRGFWNRLRAGGVEVRCYNPPRFDRPLGWLSRDHRKMISVDRSVAFVTGLCVGQAWTGNPARGFEPWRDTGVELRGPAVDDCERAFADAWSAAGEPFTTDTDVVASSQPPAGDISVRVVATVPNTAGLFRVDQLVAAMARNTLWLTDAYFAGTTPYVQALCAAARDGVDVRLLVPGASDIPMVRLFSRAGYRPLLEAGVRVFEWKGSMLHAKTAVADGRWARVGSTNLNLASWMGNRELDVIVENEPFARAVEAMFLADLTNATEVVLDARNHVRAPDGRRPAAPRPRSGGSSGRAVTGAVRIGNTVTAAITNRRLLEPVEAHIALIAGLLLLGLAALVLTFPRGFAYPVAVIAVWFAAALLVRAAALEQSRKRR
jgi:cardiolipin synthase